MTALRKIRDYEDIRAKYKIELTFGPDRKTHGPSLCGIQFWESGKYLHGEGDELMYWCKDNREGHNEGCWTPIPGANIKAGAAFCSNCKRLLSVDLCTNMRIFKLPTKTLAGILEKMFLELDSNADIYIKYHHTDVRYAAMARTKGHEVAKKLKGMHIYPLKNIIRDTINGAGLQNRFFAFLTS